MKNLKIKILIGIPASGKTTWTKEFLAKNQDWISVNRDSYRYMLRNEGWCTPKIEDLITQLVKKTVYMSLAKKMNVIIDATHVKQKYINALVDDFKYFADIDYQVFDISLEKALERDKNRERTVGKTVIKRLYKDYKILMDSFHFQPVQKVNEKPHIIPNFKSDLPDCVIFDIDGTIALMNGKRGPFDWNKVYQDDINQVVVDLINFYFNEGYAIFLLSGRDSVSRNQTKDWLGLHDIYYDDLFMRPKDDYRKDTIVKKELYETHIKGKYNVIAVYDDRLQVLDMWNKEGLFTFNVNQGNIEF